MGVEIERKFLVDRKLLPESLGMDFKHITQGYLSTNPAVRVRIAKGYEFDRIATNGGEIPVSHKAYLTIKGKGLLVRQEFEYEIPVEDGQHMLMLCPTGVWKTRYKMGRWEIDHFHNQADLWMAEIELTREDEVFDRPEWLKEEVTENPAFTNVALATPLVLAPWKTT